MAGASATEIRDGWKSGLDAFMAERQPYLLYPYDPQIGLN